MYLAYAFDGRRYTLISLEGTGKPVPTEQPVVTKDTMKRASTAEVRSQFAFSVKVSASSSSRTFSQGPMRGRLRPSKRK